MGSQQSQIELCPRSRGASVRGAALGGLRLRLLGRCSGAGLGYRADMAICLAHRLGSEEGRGAQCRLQIHHCYYSGSPGALRPQTLASSGSILEEDQPQLRGQIGRSVHQCLGTQGRCRASGQATTRLPIPLLYGYQRIWVSRSQAAAALPQVPSWSQLVA